MSTKHTPGPWKVIDISSKKGVVYRRIDSRRRNVGFVTAYGEPNQGVSEANARLIAAAPELLEALKALSFAAMCRDNTMGDQCRLIEVKAELAEANKKAIAAIAKATP